MRVYLNIALRSVTNVFDLQPLSSSSHNVGECRLVFSYYAKNGRLNPTAKRGKEIKQQ